MSTTLQTQARALGDPTRHRIFEYLADASTPVGVAELTELLGLNHNAIRQHLAKLVDARLVIESTAAPVGRGRPRLEYSIDPSAESRWGVTGPYERLSMMLAEIVRSGDTPVEVGRRTARRDRITAAGSGDPVDVIVHQMSRQGFEPTVRRQGDVVQLTLHECPFVSAVATSPDTVCELHLGLAQGAAEAIGGITVEELVPRDPFSSNCRIRCRIDAQVDGADPVDHVSPTDASG